MKHNAYQLISELLNTYIPGSDMLITKPSLYSYVPNDQIQNAESVGLKGDENNLIHAYFTRIPNRLDHYKEFLSTHSPAKIQLSKLKRVKGQEIKIRPVNVKGAGEVMSEDDIKKTAEKNHFFSQFFEQGHDLKDIPHVTIQVQKGVLPAFCLKVLTPEKRLISDDIL